MSRGRPFSFRFVTTEEVEKEIRRLNTNKACQEQDIPVKIIKLNCDIFFTIYLRIFQ